MHTKSLLVVAASAAALAGFSVGPAFAGEVAGPPGTPNEPFSGSGKPTGIRGHANSICAFNGLNDMDPEQGPIDSIVQTPHTQGVPGQAGEECRGGLLHSGPPSR
jgi:hypothetical protein